MISEGRTLEEVMAAEPTAAYDPVGARSDGCGSFS